LLYVDQSREVPCGGHIRTSTGTEEVTLISPHIGYPTVSTIIRRSFLAQVGSCQRRGDVAVNRDHHDQRNVAMVCAAEEAETFCFYDRIGPR